MSLVEKMKGRKWFILKNDWSFYYTGTIRRHRLTFVHRKTSRNNTFISVTMFEIVYVGDNFDEYIMYKLIS